MFLLFPVSICRPLVTYIGPKIENWWFSVETVYLSFVIRHVFHRHQYACVLPFASASATCQPAFMTIGSTLKGLSVMVQRHLLLCRVLDLFYVSSDLYLCGIFALLLESVIGSKTSSNPFQVKLVTISVYLPKIGTDSIDHLTSDSNYCVSLTCNHPITKRVKTNLYGLSNSGCRV